MGEQRLQRYTQKDCVERYVGDYYNNFEKKRAAVKSILKVGSNTKVGEKPAEEEWNEDDYQSEWDDQNWNNDASEGQANITRKRTTRSPKPKRHPYKKGKGKDAYKGSPLNINKGGKFGKKGGKKGSTKSSPKGKTPQEQSGMLAGEYAWDEEYQEWIWVVQQKDDEDYEDEDYEDEEMEQDYESDWDRQTGWIAHPLGVYPEVHIPL